ncbi:MAG: hypothetical protein NZ899_08930 [Thermoguttaceae bacterium]|nr:hypothetical protein [Thermoguttaceae bacterium]MDW8079913.1 hypothetical protein [Thermoguttaceae bacterium]
MTVHLTPSQADAEFYRLVHDLLEARKCPVTFERRSEERIPLWTRYRVAPVLGPTFPRPEGFAEATCLDINRCGFAFLWPTLPDFKEVIAELGTRSEPIYVLAEVIYSQPVYFWECGLVEPSGGSDQGNQISRPTENQGSHGGPQKLFKVGCRFIRRVERGELGL